MDYIIADVIGVVGVMFIIFAYFLLQAEKAKPNSWSYLLLNLIGAFLLLYSLFWTWNTASVVIEIFWIIISLYGIWRKITKAGVKAAAYDADKNIETS